MGGWMIPVVAIAAWAAIVIMRMHLLGRTREQLHRERLAMIERGLVPPPDTNPAGFAAIDWNPGRSGRSRDRGSDSRYVGILLTGIGLGLTVMFYLLNGTRTIGVGVLVIMVGLTFLVNAIFEARSSLRSDASRKEDPLHKPVGPGGHHDQ
jgi:uncharacterized protein DUF6249